VRDLLGDRVEDVQVERRTLRVGLFGTPEEFREYFVSHYGPTIAVYRAIADDPERVAALDAALVELARRFDQAAPGEPLVLDWEYLLVTARRSGTGVS
jgi:hypothetical protein